MQRTHSQFARLMELDRQIRGGKHPNCLTFAADWEVTQKTVQRDIDYLRDQCGAPVVYHRTHKGFRYENPTWMLPAVMLSEGELLAVLLGARVLDQYQGTPVARQLTGIYSKLAALLPGRVSVAPEFLYSRFSVTSPPARAVRPEIWSTMIRGLLDERQVIIRYARFDQRSRPDKTSTICPYHIASLQGEWYVFGVHAGHSDVRQFSMARIEAAKVTHERFSVPIDFDPKSLLASAFGRYAAGDHAHTVRLLFSREVADWITERQWHPQQSLKRRRNGYIELAFPAKGLFEVQRWVLSWGHHVKVLAPVELRRNVQREITMMKG